MGACSSKPKTTEFEPLKKTESEDVSPDREIDTVGAAHASTADTALASEHSLQSLMGEPDATQASERSLQNLMGEPDKEEIPAKSEEVVANASAEAMEKRELIAGEEEPLKVEVSSSAEAANGVQKDDVGDKEGAKDKASSVGEGVGGGAIDGDDIRKDEVIVLNEVGDGVADKGEVHIDKTVTLNEEKAHESLDKGSITTHDNESHTAQDFTKPPCVESPISGVAQSVEPIHVDDVSESVGVVIAEATTSDDSTTSLAAENSSDHAAKIEGDASTGANMREVDLAVAKEKVNLSPGLPQDTENALGESVSIIDAAQPAENEVLREGSKVSPLLVNVPDESGTNAVSGIDLLPKTVEAETSVEGTLEDTMKSDMATDPQKEVEDCKSEPLGETTVGAKSTAESHVKVTENEGNVRTLDQSEADAPKSLEDIDAEISVEQKVETAPEEVPQEKGEVIVDEPSVLPQALAMEESVKDSKLKATSDEAIAEPIVETERKQKVKELQAVESTPAEDKIESADTESFISSVEKSKSAPGEGEAAFQDASDVPLKVDVNNVE
eukprot:c15410_g1_i1 orf=373-2040(-)